jgi:hypothetical protein
MDAAPLLFVALRAFGAVANEGVVLDVELHPEMFGIVDVDHGDGFACADQERTGELHALVASRDIFQPPKIEQRIA